MVINILSPGEIGKGGGMDILFCSSGGLLNAGEHEFMCGSDGSSKLTFNYENIVSVEEPISPKWRNMKEKDRVSTARF